MTATITQGGRALLIVGTNQDIIDALISEGYPEPTCMAIDGSGNYNVIASRRNY